MSKDLKTFEAELATLVPRTDRLDRDRLIFLAGEQSAAASNRRATAHRGWVWPAAFSAMTAVAATLAMIVLLRPQPQVVVRLVEVPAEPVVAEDPSPSETIEPALSEPEHAEPPNDSPADVPGAGGSIFWALIGLPWPPDRPAAWPNSTRPNPRQELQILAEGRDPWPRPAATATQSTKPQTVPIPRRQMLKQMLDEQARADRPVLHLPPAAEDLPQSSQRTQRLFLGKKFQQRLQPNTLNLFSVSSVNSVVSLLRRIMQPESAGDPPPFRNNRS